MQKELIEKIEQEFPSDGLTGMVFYHLCQREYDNLTDVETLPDGSAGLVMKGSGSVEERRELFLKIYDGCKAIAEHIKKHS